MSRKFSHPSYFLKKNPVKKNVNFFAKNWIYSKKWFIVYGILCFQNLKYKIFQSTPGTVIIKSSIQITRFPQLVSILLHCTDCNVNKLHLVVWTIKAPTPSCVVSWPHGSTGLVDFHSSTWYVTLNKGLGSYQVKYVENGMAAAWY